VTESEHVGHSTIEMFTRPVDLLLMALVTAGGTACTRQGGTLDAIYATRAIRYDPAGCDARVAGAGTPYFHLDVTSIEGAVPGDGRPIVILTLPCAGPDASTCAPARSIDAEPHILGEGLFLELLYTDHIAYGADLPIALGAAGSCSFARFRGDLTWNDDDSIHFVKEQWHLAGDVQGPCTRDAAIARQDDMVCTASIEVDAVPVRAGAASMALGGAR